MSDSASKQREKLVAACAACVTHARDLLASAKAVDGIGKHNISYHLAALALEEIGKRELYQIHYVAATVGEVPSWQIAATQSHTKKLFWCFFGLQRIQDLVDQQQFFETQDAAADIHNNRLAGLYVSADQSGVSIPSKRILAKQASALISLAEMVMANVDSQEPRDHVSKDDTELQLWFLHAFDDPLLRNKIINKQSLDELKSINNVAEWTRKKKLDIEKEEAELKSLIDEELKRGITPPTPQNKERWKIRFRVRTTSNNVRGKPLKKWNEKLKWMKLIEQQGKLKREEIIVEIVLGDDVPIQALRALGTTLALHFVIAINLATSGFWWWPLPPNRENFYDQISDLQKNLGIEALDPSFAVVKERVDLTDVHIENTQRCILALPYISEASFVPYLGGLNFLALNSFHWRCEAQAFLQFLQSFKSISSESQYTRAEESTGETINRLLLEKYPQLDESERTKFIELVAQIERSTTPPGVTLGDVYLIKLLCETLCRDVLVPEILKNRIQDVASEKAGDSKE